MTSAKVRDGLRLGKSPYRYVSEYWSPEIVFDTSVMAPSTVIDPK